MFFTFLCGEVRENCQCIQYNISFNVLLTARQRSIPRKHSQARAFFFHDYTLGRSINYKVNQPDIFASYVTVTLRRINLIHVQHKSNNVFHCHLDNRVNINVFQVKEKCETKINYFYKSNMTVM